MKKTELNKAFPIGDRKAMEYISKIIKETRDFLNIPKEAKIVNINLGPGNNTLSVEYVEDL